MKLEKLINLYFEDLTENDRLIWKYIKNNIEKCSNLSAEELAKECNVSRATILRFAKKLSLNGFSKLKSTLKLEHDEKEEIVSVDYLETNDNNFTVRRIPVRCYYGKEIKTKKCFGDFYY